MAKAETQTAIDVRWKAERDAQTLAEAHVIISDPKRLGRAQKAADKLAKEAKRDFEGLLRVSGKSSKVVEGMKVL